MMKLRAVLQTLLVLGALMSCYARGSKNGDAACHPCFCNSTVQTMECFDLPYIVKPVPKVSKVIINGGIFRTFDQSKFDNLTTGKISELTLNNCQLSIVNPRTIFSRLTQLQILRLNRTMVIPEYLRLAFYGLRSTKIRELYLDDLDPAPLPCHFFDGLKTSRITVISLKRNSIRKLQFVDHSDVFFGVPNLKTLIMSENQMVAIEDNTFEGLDNLEHLFLDLNKIKRLAPCSFHLPSLRTLCLADNRFDFSSLVETETLFKNLGKLEVLNISGNKLKRVTSENLEDLFQNLVSLKVLKLERTGLTILPSLMFNGMTSLQELYLERNMLKTWEPDTFLGLPKLEMVFLNKNKIQSLRMEQINSIVNKSQTVQVNLSNNPFSCDCKLYGFLKWLRGASSTAMDYPDFYSCLSPVDLFETPLSKVVMIDSDCPTDTTWYINGKKTFCYPCMCTEHGTSMDCQVIELSSTPRPPTSVKRIHFTGVTFKELNRMSFHNISYTRIKDFIMTDCFVEHADNNTLSNFLSLETVDLTGTVIPVEDLIGVIKSIQARKLSTLLLDDINLESIPDNLFDGFENSNVRRLSLADNFLKDLPPEGKLFSHFPRLESLNVSNNQISALNVASLKGLRYLVELDIGGNYLQSILLNSFNLPNITRLQLTKNRCLLKEAVVKTLLEKLTSLKELNLSGNNLSHLDFSGMKLFQGLRNLTVLDLSETSLNEIPRDFLTNSFNFHTLNLGHNQISVIQPKFVKKLGTVKVLNLQDNSIERISQDTLKKLNNLSRITVMNLAGNPFRCGCEMLYLMNWIKTTRITLTEYPQRYLCAFPSEMNGKLLSEINFDLCRDNSSLGLASIIPVSVSASLGVLLLGVTTTVLCFRRRDIWLYSVRLKARLQSQRVDQLVDRDW